MELGNRENLAQEKNQVTSELEFFGFDGENLPKRDFNYVGTHTSQFFSPITSFYPVVLIGISQIYNFLDVSNLSSNEQAIFLQSYLRNKFRMGKILTNEQIEEIKEKIKKGDYFLQYQGYVNGAIENVEKRAERMGNLFAMKTELEGEGPLANLLRRKGKLNDLYGNYSLIHSNTGIEPNKRITKSWFNHIQRALQTYYQEVDFSKALLTEMILDAPFLESIPKKKGSNPETAQKHQEFFNKSLPFIKKFNPSLRMAVFEEFTADFNLDWTKEEPTPTP